ncbi:MAG: 4-hydroxy-3-methylbut-2-enyl diphosphate reductase [Gammaproteobacteria bacterium]|nr:4-hydroxy-3-methylbut-2-enyl diphosphate reductase [Gammaproteobacteria bacterium]
MKVILANPRGFCAGVDRAIEIVERAIEKFGAPIYVRHEVVHNRFVVGQLRDKGAVFVDELDEVPPDSVVIFSAHGVSRAVRTDALGAGLQVLDATCPLVTKVHREVERYREDGVEVVLIGHAGHPEVEGTMGQADGGMYLVEKPADVDLMEVTDPDNLAYVTQTTLSVDDTRVIIDALRRRFPNIHGPRKDDICYATQNRQDAVKRLAERCDVMLVVGSPNSSNSNRLRELAEQCGVPGFLVDGPGDIERSWLEDKEVVGVTAGASAPENLVQEVVEQLVEWGATSVEDNRTRTENVSFALPLELRSA